MLSNLFSLLIMSHSSTNPILIYKNIKIVRSNTDTMIEDRNLILLLFCMNFRWLLLFLLCINKMRMSTSV